MPPAGPTPEGTALALASALCFGLAMITGRQGLRRLDARSGASVSVPTAAIALILVAPGLIRWDGLSWPAVGVFAAVGLVFPAVVTLLTFRANQLLGPTVTSAVSGTAPLFAIATAALLLHEAVPAHATGSALGVVLGVVWLSLAGGTARARSDARHLVWPLMGSAVRGCAQAAARYGLLLWPDPWAAGLVGYAVSAAVVLLVQRLRPAGGAAVSTMGASAASAASAAAALPAWRRPGARWFVATGLLNSSALLLMYAALGRSPVWAVAPIVAGYPVVTALLGAALLPDERLTVHTWGGLLLTVGAIAWLVGAGPG